MSSSIQYTSYDIGISTDENPLRYKLTSKAGFWDPSASTSTQSQTSEGTKLRLDQEKRNVVEQRKKYEEAQARFKQENEDREAARGKRRAEKAEQRKEEQILRQRRHGRWRMGNYFSC